MTNIKHLDNNKLAAAPARKAKQQQPVAPESAKAILPHITLTIKTGQISPKMRHDWVTFWQRLTASAKSEVRNAER